ncbi:MAG: 3-oxoacyl-ACP synthase [Gammaproteobacteria bacterium]|nr:MAG: 3-oxoacyl-ACP synthase [Gammaproteobacteria bacterium]
MTAVGFAIERWAAWAPAEDDGSIETAGQWADWAAGTLAMADNDASPALPFINAMLRRRLSRLSRLALKVAYEAAAGDHSLPTVFCSRHGEIHRTRGLLADLNAGEPLSPMAFSLSVHNTASGLYSIASGNTAASTAIAAGRDTLAMAVIEATGLLLQHERVLLVFAEEPLPEDYREFADEQTAAFGLALLLARDHGERWQLAAADQPSGTARCQGLDFLQALAGDRPQAHSHGERHGWRWTRA